MRGYGIRVKILISLSHICQSREMQIRIDNTKNSKEERVYQTVKQYNFWSKELAYKIVLTRKYFCNN